MTRDVSISTVLLGVLVLQTSVFVAYAPVLTADHATPFLDVLARVVAGVGFLFALGFVVSAYRGPGDVVLGD